ncbi:MAG: DUF1499 domain-containing protein [Hyphomicrobium sp.]
MTSRIEYAAEQPPSFLARWGSRLAFFSALLLVAALFLHRIFGLPTPYALNLAGTAFAGAALAVVMAAVAGLDIWVTGRQGTARVVIAGGVAMALLAVPVATWIISRDWPAITDVTTDTANPPAFVELVGARPAGANPLAYRQDDFAALQTSGYPDLKTLAVPRSVEDTYEVVLQALSKLKLKPVAQTPPAEAADGAGSVELSDRTLILGFRDDVAIRVGGDDTSSKVDVRSSSRYGRHDFGRNAERVRMILKEIVGRLEATVPTVGRRAPAVNANKAAKKPVLKRPRADSRTTAGQRPKAGASRPAIRRAPEQSE